MEKLKTEPIDCKKCRTDLRNFLPTFEWMFREGTWYSGKADANINRLVEAVYESKQNPKSGVLFIMGAHILKAGLIQYVCEMIHTGGIDFVNVNGAFIVHEYELARAGATSEDVSETLPKGMFGMRTETVSLNDMSIHPKFGLGYSYQQYMQDWYPLSKFMQKHENSFLSMQCGQAGIPFTVSTIIGGDINHMYPNFDAAAWGAGLHADFLRIVEFMEKLDEVVLICAGSATIGPEIFQKALSLARNRSGGPKVCKVAVMDLVELPEDAESIAPQEGTSLYYYRPWKTLLSRAVTGEGSESMYIQGDFYETLPVLYVRLWCRFSVK